jgi:hypothetical protein
MDKVTFLKTAFCCQEMSIFKCNPRLLYNELPSLTRLATLLCLLEFSDKTVCVIIFTRAKIAMLSIC